MKTKILLCGLILILQSCKSEINCTEPIDDIGRTCNLKLNPVAVKSLNIISEILSFNHELWNTNEKSGLAKVRANIISFNLNKDNKIFYINLFFYKDYLKSKLASYQYYEIPLKELIAENIIVHETSVEQYGEVSLFEIRSKFSNDKAFVFKVVECDDNNNLKSVTCSDSSTLTFFVKTEDAIVLKDAFVDFINNYETDKLVPAAVNSNAETDASTTIEEKAIEAKSVDDDSNNDIAYKLNEDYFLGKWKDRNSEFTFNPEKQFFLQWKSGNSIFTTWHLIDGKLYVGLGDNGALLRVYIFEYTPIEYHYKLDGDDNVYVAFKMSP